MRPCGLGALRRAMPHASPETCLMALEATKWDADAAYAQLKSFMSIPGNASASNAAAAAEVAAKKLKRKSKKEESSDSDDSSSSEVGTDEARRGGDAAS